MKRFAIVVLGLLLLAVGGYLGYSRWAIRHENLMMVDNERHRVIAVALAVRWDAQMRARAGISTLPVAIISHGNTVKNTEYSFLANVLAARGYLVASIQHDLPTDQPLVTKDGSLYVGRLNIYERGLQNIFFVVSEMKKLEPNADYNQLTVAGHSNGGDISMFFAQQHPELTKRVVTLDNLRVPFVAGAKILSFRSRDWKPDPGVVPDAEEAKRDGIDIVRTDGSHTDMSDRGPDGLKQRIQETLDKFLNDDDASKLGPVKSRPLASDPRAMGP